MPVTAHKAITRLLRYFSDEEQVLPPSSPRYADRWQVCAESFNAAFSEMAIALGKSYQTMRERGWLFDGQMQATVTITRGARSASVSVTGAVTGSNIAGKLLEVAGKDIRIHWQTQNNGSIYTVELQDEWSGLSGTYPAIMHGDTRVLDSDIISLVSVTNESGMPLDPVGTDRSALRVMGGPSNDYGFERRRNIRRWATRQRMSSLAGTMAQCYSVKTPNPETSNTSILTIYPPPSEPTLFRGRILTAQFSMDVASLASSQNLVSALSAITLPVSDIVFESVIFPIAAKHLMASPNFRNDSAAEEISRKYEAALLALEKLRIQHPTNKPIFFH